MPVDDLVELTLTDRVAAGGDAIGRTAGGQVIFVRGALPAERVVARVREERRDWARAEVREVIDPSPVRIEPACPWVARGCGGCQWQHVELGAQRALKVGIVADALRRIARMPDVAVDDGGGVAADGYRTTVHVAVAADGRLAYHRRGSGDLVTIDECRVAHPELRNLMDGCRLPGAGRATLRVGLAGGERLVVVAGPARRSWEVPAGAVLAGPGSRAHLHERVAGRRWRVSAGAFFQAGPAGAEALVHAVDELAGSAAGGRTVDLYAGGGLLGGALVGRHGGTLVAVESDRAAVADARHNLADLDAEVVRSAVGDWAGPPRVEPAAEGPPSRADLVIADPARSGLGRPGVATAVRFAPARIVLASCDPASMARDAALLQQVGYRLGEVRVVDLFPQTTHVEAVSRFDRA